MIELDGERIRFAHPLLASGVYAEASGRERRALHRRLGGAPPRSGGERTPPCARRRRSGRGRRGRSRARGPAGTSPRCLRGRGRAVRAGPAADARGDGGKRCHRRTVDGCGLRLGGRRKGPGQGALRRGSSCRRSPGPGAESSSTGSGRFRSTRETAAKAVELYREARSNAGDDVVLRARAEEGLASALFLLRSDLSAAADHARAAVALAGQAGDAGMEIAALSAARPDRRGDGRRANGGRRFERGRELEERAGPVQTAVSATFTLGVVPDLGRRVRRGVRAPPLPSRAVRGACRRERPAVDPAQLCWAEFLAGRWDEAERHARKRGSRSR